MAIADSMLAEFDQEARTTRRVLERVPSDKLDWGPHPRSMTIGVLALHIAGTPGFVVQMGSVDAYEMSPFTPPVPSSTAEILATYDQTMAAAREFVAGLDDAKALAMWSLVMGGKTIFAMPRIAMIRMILMNHCYHHRGQLSVYLRLLDVPVPSIYGPSADENPFA